VHGIMTVKRFQLQIPRLRDLASPSLSAFQYFPHKFVLCSALFQNFISYPVDHLKRAFRGGGFPFLECFRSRLYKRAWSGTLDGRSSPSDDRVYKISYPRLLDMSMHSKKPSPVPVPITNSKLPIFRIATPLTKRLLFYLLYNAHQIATPCPATI